MTAVPGHDCATTYLIVAMDVGSTKWVCAIGTSASPKSRLKTVPARDVTALRAEIDLAKQSFGLPAGAPVWCCYEAGRDGFWLYRVLREVGIQCRVVDPGSVPVDQRAKRVKTDRLDSQALLRQFALFLRGEAKLSVLNVPSVEAEDARHIDRERLCLRNDRTTVQNEIGSLLALAGVVIERCKLIHLAKEPERLDGLAGPLGCLPPHQQARLRRQLERLKLIDAQQVELKALKTSLSTQPKTVASAQIAQLVGLRGIGDTSARQLVFEAFSWRKFENREKAGALLGAVSAPYASDQSRREQGITKTGNARLRATMVEIAWLWVRHQPTSEITKWFLAKWGPPAKRAKLVGIVGLARKLFIALWRYVEQGVVPHGATLKPVKAA